MNIDRSPTEHKRQYNRLSVVEWAEIRALWGLGSTSLAELAERFGVTIRTIQSHFKKNNVVKGARAKLFAGEVEAEIVRQGLPDKDVTIERAKAAKETAYRNACQIEDMVMAQLHAASDDPTQVHRSVMTIKALASAAAAIERVHAIKRIALGLDNGSVLADELPVLEIRELTLDEVEKIRASQASPQSIEPDECFVPTQPESLEDIPASDRDHDIVIEDGFRNVDDQGCRVLS